MFNARSMSRPGGALLLGLLLGACSSLPPAAGGQTPSWVSGWVSAQQIPEPRNALPPADLRDATLRQVFRTSLGGSRVRLRLSNVHGTAPLVLDDVALAHSRDPASSEIDPATSARITFAEERTVTIPAGAYLLSDPVDFPVEPLDHLVVSLHYPSPPERQTGHPGSRATSWILPGNRVGDAELPGAASVDHWYQIAALDVEAEPSTRALIVLGDSITDGYGVMPNTDTRWTDFLIARVRGEPGLRDSLAVLNAGLGGNRLLLDELGPNGLSRFDRDVLGTPGAAYVIVLLGVNDLGVLSRDETATPSDYDAMTKQMIAAYEQMVVRARENGVRIVGGTIMPFAGSSIYPSNPLAEAARRAVNAWIRTPGHFDAVIDFDARMRAPGDPSKLDPALDCGDHLHPSIEGYRAMAEFVPLGLFKTSSR